MREPNRHEYSAFIYAPDVAKQPFCDSTLIECNMQTTIGTHYIRFTYVGVKDENNFGFSTPMYDMVRMANIGDENPIRMIQKMLEPVEPHRLPRLLITYMEAMMPIHAPWDLDAAVLLWEQDKSKVVCSAVQEDEKTIRYIPLFALFHVDTIRKINPDIPILEQVGQPGMPERIPYIVPKLCDIRIEDGKEEVERRYREYVQKGRHDTNAITDYALAWQTEDTYQQDASSYNRGVEQNVLPLDYRNTYFNHYAIYMDFEKKVAADISFGKIEKHIPALIFGSGPSLDKAGPLLKDWKGGVFCSSSHAPTLVYYGLDPQYIVAYDINTQWGEFEPDELWTPERNATLVSHPGMNPYVLNKWPKKKLYFREMDTSNIFFTKVLPAAYGDKIVSQMFLFSCTVAAELSLAHFMGYSPIFMVGCDFAAGRFSKWQLTPPGFKPERLKLDPLYKSVKKVDGRWVQYDHGLELAHIKALKGTNGIITNSIQAFYKRSLLCVWRIDHSALIQTSDESLIDELPFASIEDVIKFQGLGFSDRLYTHQQIEDVADTYLARHNQFIIQFENKSVKVVESADDDWYSSVNQYLNLVKAEITRIGEDPKMIDIDKNMARFKVLKERIDAENRANKAQAG